MISGLNHITLCVADLDRSWAFYCDVLGAVPKARWAKGAYLELGPIWLCLEVAAEMTLRSDDTHIAFSCTDFAAMSARIAEKARLWKDNRSPGQSLYFLDPDGHKLELHDGNLASRLASYEDAGRDDITLYPVPSTTP